MTGSKIFLPCRNLGYVSNHIPLQVRYIKSRKENLIITCVGKSFHTYGISHFSLLTVSSLHPDNISCMTADAYHVYTACDKEIYAWRRGTELKHTYRGHKHPVHLMIPFGAHLISIDENNVVKIWDVKAETLFLELSFSKTFNITSVLHPSTYINKVLFGSDKGQMQIWNINNAKLIYTFKGWKQAITCLEQAPAIDVVAVGLINGRIILHNLKYDETVMEFTQDWGTVTSISFRSDGHCIMATGSTSGHIVFWDLEEKKVSSQLLSAHDSSVNSIVCLPNEPLLLTSSPDNTLKLWIFDLSDGGARLLRIREGHSASPTYLRYHGSNGQNILSCAGDSTLRIFNTQTEQFNKNLGKASYNRKISKKKGRGVEDPLKMPPVIKFTSEITREKEWDNIAAIHEGLAMVTTWSYDKVKMGNLKLLPERFQKNNNLNVDVVATCLNLSHCGNFVVVGYSTGFVDKFNMQSGIWRDTYGNPKAHDCSVRGVAIDRLNQVVITGGRDGNLKFWHFDTKGRCPLTVLRLDESVNFIYIHQESSLIAIALEDFTINIVDIDTHRVVRKFAGHTAQITDLSFSPDSRWLISSSMDCSLRTWDIPSGQLVDQFATEQACISLSMSPTGEALVTAHVDHIGIFLWSNKTLYTKVTLKALTPVDNPELVRIPMFSQKMISFEDEDDNDDEKYWSPDQISEHLITLSGLPSSQWQNLLDIDIIRRRNKPKNAPKAPKTAPFFLPTVSSLNGIQFDVTHSKELNSKILKAFVVDNLTEFGKLLKLTTDTKDFSPVIDKLKSFGPSLIDHEIKSLSPENGGSVDVMLQYFKCIEFMLKSKKNFELAEAYMNIFLKIHGLIIAQEANLRNYLPNIMSCHNVAWNRLQDNFLYILCILQNLKTM